MTKEEALNILKELHDKAPLFEKGALEVFFPEFKKSESEDKKIRKRILLSLQKDIMATKNSGCNTKDLEKCVAWLEKQDRQKPTSDTRYEVKVGDGIGGIYNTPFDYEHATTTQKDFAPKVEPKFKVGDWVIHIATGYPHQIRELRQNVSNDKFGYKLVDGGYIGSEEVVNYRLWTIQDAKDGDVLASSKSIFLFKEIYMAGKPGAYCAVMDGSFIKCPEGCWTNEQCYPATKEQRELLFQKMEENGYAWDAEKKETKVLISNGGDFEPELSHQEVTKKNEQDKWTEEDEMFWNLSIEAATSYYGLPSETVNWLTSLKERVHPKPQWTEKDIKMINILCSIFEVSNGYYKVDKPGQYAIRAEEILDWLKLFKRKLL